jgi:PAS domain S-box-containing protein
MPEMNGIELLKRVRATDKRIPFIIFTGKGREDIAIEAFESGADFYVQKGGSPTPQFADLAQKLRVSVERRIAENQLREQREEHERFFTVSRDLFCIMTPTGHFVQLNPEWERVFGYPIKELEGKHVLDYLHPDDVETSKSVLAELAKKNPLTNFINRFRSRDGSYRSLEWRSYPYDGKLLYASARDITERLQAEAVARESAEFYSTLFINNHAAMLLLDPDSGQIVDTNKAACMFFKYSHEDLTKKYIYDLNKRPKNEVLKELAEAKRKKELHYFTQYFLPNGDIRDVEVYSGYITVKGKSLLYSINHDVTKQKKAERELKTLYGNLEKRVQERTLQIAKINRELEAEVDQRTKAEETLRQTLSLLNAALESTADAILVVNTSGEMTRFNRKFVSMWNIPPSFLNPWNDKAVHDFMISHLKNPEQSNATMDDLSKKPGEESFDEVAFLDGRIFERYSKPQKIGDVIVGRVWSFRDITERTQMEQKVARSLKEKEILLKEIHHRVKNNMQVISSLLFMQAETLTDETVKDILRESQNRVKSIALVHEKLYQSTDLDRIDYIDYLRRITSHLFESFEVNPSRIALKIDAEPVYLNIDKAVPCSLIVNEMLSNSLKHAFPGGRKGVITIDLKSRGENFILTYSDDGVGIPETIAFDRTESMGMQLIMGLTEQINGSIVLDRHGGTKYTITFPASNGGRG